MCVCWGGVIEENKELGRNEGKTCDAWHLEKAAAPRREAAAAD